MIEKKDLAKTQSRQVFRPHRDVNSFLALHLGETFLLKQLTFAKSSVSSHAAIVTDLDDDANWSR